MTDLLEQEWKYISEEIVGVFENKLEPDEKRSLEGQEENELIISRHESKMGELESREKGSKSQGCSNSAVPLNIKNMNNMENTANPSCSKTGPPNQSENKEKDISDLLPSDRQLSPSLDTHNLDPQSSQAPPLSNPKSTQGIENRDSQMAEFSTEQYPVSFPYFPPHHNLQNEHSTFNINMNMNTYVPPHFPSSSHGQGYSASPSLEAEDLASVLRLQNMAADGNFEDLEREIEINPRKYTPITLNNALLEAVKKSRPTSDHILCAQKLIGIGADVNTEDDKGS
jgi:hypothetical protein